MSGRTDDGPAPAERRATAASSGDTATGTNDVSWNQVLEPGGFLVDEAVRVKADVGAILQSGTDAAGQ